MAGAKPLDFAALQDFLSAKPIVPKLFTQTARPAPPPPERPSETDPGKHAEYRRLWEQLINTHRALDEIKGLRFESKTDAKVTELLMPNRDTGKEGKSKLSIVRNRLIVASPLSIQALHTNTKRLIGDVALQPGLLSFRALKCPSPSCKAGWKPSMGWHPPSTIRPSWR